MVLAVRAPEPRQRFLLLREEGNRAGRGWCADLRGVRRQSLLQHEGAGQQDAGVWGQAVAPTQDQAAGVAPTEACGTADVAKALQHS